LKVRFHILRVAMEFWATVEPVALGAVGVTVAMDGFLAVLAAVELERKTHLVIT
jgi:hypothetical protein